MIDSEKLIQLYIKFFEEKGHKVIPNVSLVPEHDPTVLFTPAGMHPLIPYLLGQPHPLGKRLVNVQRCLRTDDIEKVGDAFHLTFFEMLGNWSLGDYFKEESIKWSLEFLTSKKWLGLDKERIYVTVFAGDKDLPRDEESARIWQSLGIPRERIFFLSREENFWGPVGSTGPCGPCTEIFYDSGKEACSKNCRPGCNCGKYFELWNNVFMEYNKTKEGKFEPLKQKNVDTGMGVERTVAILQGRKSVYEIETLRPIYEKIKEIAGIEKSDEKQEISIRIVTDHLRASTFILGDENPVLPSNVDRGYILRRLIRRAIRYGKILGIEKEFLGEIAKVVIEIYKKRYPLLQEKENFILEELGKEENKFRNTLSKGLKKFEEMAKGKMISGKDAFLLFQSFGFPFEMTKELAKEKGIKVDEEGFWKEYEKHKEISRKGAEKKFKGGLIDASEQTIKLHTATHLLNEALRRVLKRKDIVQKGSNITPERLRFDFNFERKLTEEEIKKIEDLVNEQIRKGLPVWREEMTVEEAKKRGAQAVFEHKYGEKVSVYFIGNFSVEICGGPHVKNTKELGKFKIIKEEGVAAGIRRIKAILE
ncbi:MAG: alanine--tRNA ligase [Candidatus Aenigmatarchaeota archaeon]